MLAFNWPFARGFLNPRFLRQRSRWLALASTALRRRRRRFFFALRFRDVFRPQNWGFRLGLFLLASRSRFSSWPAGHVDHRRFLSPSRRLLDLVRAKTNRLEQRSAFTRC